MFLPYQQLTLFAVSMHRLVMKKVTLADGTVLPKDSRIIFANRFFDEKLYLKPREFDAYRAMHEREKVRLLSSLCAIRPPQPG